MATIRIEGQLVDVQESRSRVKELIRDNVDGFIELSVIVKKQVGYSGVKEKYVLADFSCNYIIAIYD